MQYSFPNSPQESEPELKDFNPTDSSLTDQIAYLENEVASLDLINKELLRFTYVACHHIQEPLRTISSLSSIISERYANAFDERGQKSVQHITSSAIKIQVLIKCLLEYGRIGKKSKKELVDTNRLVESVKNDLNHLIEKSEATIILNNLSGIQGHSSELRRLFHSLIANAIKFQRPQVKPRIIITAKQESHHTLFSVKDNGLGIPKENLEHIFTIFYRLNQIEKTITGHGMGLAYSRKIVQIHGGRIWAESKTGIGSTFYFTIPN